MKSFCLMKPVGRLGSNGECWFCLWSTRYNKQNEEALPKIQGWKRKNEKKWKRKKQGWKFFSKMDDILAHNPNTQPPVSIDSSLSKQITDENESNEESNDENLEVGMQLWSYWCTVLCVFTSWWELNCVSLKIMYYLNNRRKLLWSNRWN